MARHLWEHALGRAKRLAATFPGVTGVDYGFRYKKEKRGRELCVRFHVARKLTLKALGTAEKLPRAIDGFPCDVVQAAYQPHASPRGLSDPLRPGVSIGNVARRSTGTLGALVRDGRSGQVGLLSNWHVFCASVDCQPGEEISQPGPLHLGANPARPVGRLERWLGLNSGCDAAFAILGEKIAEDPAVFDLGIVIRGIEEPVHGMHLVKAGAASGTTRAIVDGVEGAFEMDYSPFGDQTRWMDGIRLVQDPQNPSEEVSLGGDSGAVWINPETQCAVALHFGGEDGLGPLADYAVAHPISKVARLLDVSVTDGDSADSRA